MSSFLLYKRELHSIFQLLGYNENDIKFSVAWTLSKCPIFMQNIIKSIFHMNITDTDTIIVSAQDYNNENGITDIEITDKKNFHIIIEAKKARYTKRCSINAVFFTRFNENIFYKK